MSIIAEKLNTDITSVWLSNDGDGICDLREFVVNIFTFRPKLIVSALKEASSLDHLNGHYLSRSYPVTQDMKGKSIFQLVYSLNSVYFNEMYI